MTFMQVAQALRSIPAMVAGIVFVWLDGDPRVVLTALIVIIGLLDITTVIMSQWMRATQGLVIPLSREEPE